MKKWSLANRIAFWGLLLAAVGLFITIMGVVFNVFGQPKVSLGQPQFHYVFEGAYDQSKPEYEVAFPLGWDDSQKSNARILIRADYSGSNYAGVTYIKIQKVNGDVVTVGQWNDFSTEAGKQQPIPLNFTQLFDYSGNTRSIANLDPTASDPLAPIRGHFKIYVENRGQVIPGSETTVNVYNSPWFHRTYFDNYEISPGDKLKAYVEVINYGAEADFSVATCPYRVATTSYQLDPKMVHSLDTDGWWPDRQGNFQRVLDVDQQTAVHLKQGETKTVVIDLPANATSEQGAYTYIVYLMKKLDVLDYGTDNWVSNWRTRDSRQYSSYVVVGQ